MIGIRADANELISTGHIMRCIAIAQQLEELKYQYVFIVADFYTSNFLTSKGYNSICLETNWKDKNSETKELVETIIRYDITKLLIDSYEVTKFYFEQLRYYTKIIYIDDLYEFEYPVDLLINYSPKVDNRIYKKYLNKNIKLLLGREFTPLRNEFLDSSIIVKDKVLDVLITTGGSDNYCLIEKLLQRLIVLKKYKNIRFHIVIGSFFINVERLQALTESNVNMICYENVKSMAEIMKKCDVAISAAGTTLAELCACGLPTICFAIADNQLSGVEIFGSEEIMMTVGDIRNDINSAIDKIISQLDYLIINKRLREELSLKSKCYIDGKGALRIAKSIIEM